MTTRTSLSIAFAIAITACGSSDNSGGGGGGSLPSGTLGGTAFTPADATAVALAPKTCTISGVSVSASALALIFTNVASTCSAFQAVGACNDKANATAIFAEIAKGNISGTAVTAIGPGTYPLSTGNPTPDASGNFTFTSINYSKTNATCVDAASSVSATSGSVTLTSVTPAVAGSITVAFSDGSSFSGNFSSLALCGVSFDVCSLESCSGPGTCVQ